MVHETIEQKNVNMISNMNFEKKNREKIFRFYFFETFSKVRHFGGHFLRFRQTKGLNIF